MNARALREQYFKHFKNRGIPVEGIFELTGRCNFNCKMCYVHTKSNSEFLRTEKNGDWWISQIDAACDKGMIFALLTGGECLLHPDFRRIYLHLLNKGVLVRINTNGLLLTKQNVDFLKENPPLEIQMTLYGADNNAYEKVTGVSAFCQIEENILQVREAGLNLWISLTPNNFAPGETERIVEYLKKDHIPYSINESMFTPYDEATPQTISSQEVSTDEKIRYLRLMHNAKYEQISLEDIPPVGGGKTGELRGVKCTAGRVSFVINHEGYMLPCTAMYHLRVPLNTAEDFEIAWDKVQQGCATYLMPVECDGCPYYSACISCPVSRGGKVGNGHCDPSICEMTRQLVAAGIKKMDKPSEENEESLMIH